MDAHFVRASIGIDPPYISIQPCRRHQLPIVSTAVRTHQVVDRVSSGIRRQRKRQLPAESSGSASWPTIQLACLCVTACRRKRTHLPLSGTVAVARAAPRRTLWFLMTGNLVHPVSCSAHSGHDRGPAVMQQTGLLCGLRALQRSALTRKPRLAMLSGRTVSVRKARESDLQLSWRPREWCMAPLAGSLHFATWP